MVHLSVLIVQWSARRKAGSNMDRFFSFFFLLLLCLVMKPCVNLYVTTENHYSIGTASLQGSSMKHLFWWTKPFLMVLASPLVFEVIKVQFLCCLMAPGLSKDIQHHTWYLPCSCTVGYMRLWPKNHILRNERKIACVPVLFNFCCNYIRVEAMFTYRCKHQKAQQYDMFTMDSVIL